MSAQHHRRRRQDQRARAVRDYPGLPLNEAIRKVTEDTADQYFKDSALGTLEPNHQPRATDNIPRCRP